MNFHTMLQRRASKGQPIKVGVIGAEESLAPGCLLLGLTGGTKVTRPVAKGEHLIYADVSMDPSGAAYKLRKQMENGEVR